MSQVMYLEDHWSVAVTNHTNNINNWVTQPLEPTTTMRSLKSLSIQPITAAILSQAANTWRIDLSKPLSVPTATTGHFLLSADHFQSSYSLSAAQLGITTPIVITENLFVSSPALDLWENLIDLAIGLDICDYDLQTETCSCDSDRPKGDPVGEGVLGLVVGCLAVREKENTEMVEAIEVWKTHEEEWWARERLFD